MEKYCAHARGTRVMTHIEYTISARRLSGLFVLCILHRVKSNSNRGICVHSVRHFIVYYAIGYRVFRHLEGSRRRRTVDLTKPNRIRFSAVWLGIITICITYSMVLRTHIVPHWCNKRYSSTMSVYSPLRPTYV